LNTLGTAELQLFQTAIARRLGLRFDDGKLTFLAEVLARRIGARRIDAASYLDLLQRELEADDELRALALELTVGETYFFRHAEQFNALCQVVLPERASARAKSRTLRLLSVGCASGEEPYTLAILVQKQGLEPAFKVEILGMDFNTDSLEKARRAVYSTWSLRETPPDVREHWFISQGQKFQLVASLREAVQFHEHNLVKPSAELLPPGRYDVIFCRNVLMYFTPEHAADIVERLTRALLPGGYLFLGHAETLRGLSHSFHLRHTHNTFYYQRKDVLPEQEAAASPAHDQSPWAAHAAPAANGEWVDTWLQAVQRSSDRIRTLSDARPEQPQAAPQAVVPTLLGRNDLRQPLELLQSERYAEALSSLPEAPAAEPADPTALLLRAALLTHQGDLHPAEAACRKLLQQDELNAGAHYLLALCFERRENLLVAAEHDRTAVYLDAGFAMPHLHLGLMARRRRDSQLARQELGQALWLLEREDPARLLLFGGGFTRGALLKLCRTELENLRGAP
jgi:chemotaxis protein methyltransferase CheR